MRASWIKGLNPKANPEVLVLAERDWKLKAEHQVKREVEMRAMPRCLSSWKLGERQEGFH
jgi:hypothetical protein